MSGVTAPAQGAAVRRPRTACVAEVMGTVASVHLLGGAGGAEGAEGPAGVTGTEAAVAGFFAQMRELEAVFSPFRPDSDVSRMRRGELALADADARVAEVAEACERMERESAGRFSARWRGGFDPTGYVKGWATERAAVTHLLPLLGRGAEAVGVNVGGDLRVFTAPGSSWVWRVGIAHPLRPGELVASVELQNGAVASSGSAERGEHLIDPRAASPARGAAGATVVAADLETADAWATVAAVAGAADLSWIGRLPAASGLVVAPDGAVRRWAGGCELVSSSGSITLPGAG